VIVLLTHFHGAALRSTATHPVCTDLYFDQTKEVCISNAATF